MKPHQGEGLLFSREQIDLLRNAGSLIHKKKNSVLCRAGTSPEYCYYIESGSVVAYEHGLSGNERIFNISYAGSIILIPSMVITHRPSLSFKTAEDSDLIRISRDTLFSLIASDAAFSAALIYALSDRLIQTVDQYRQKGTYTVEWRVSNLLLEAADRSGVPYDGKLLIEEKISQQATADRLQVNRVSVARAMRSLKDHGLIEYINGFYCVRSPEQLERHMLYLEMIVR